MLKLNPYLNFLGRTEEVFNFYKSVFGGEFAFFQRFKDVPDLPGKDKMSEADLNKIMHVALPVGEGMLMATDALESMGHTLTVGNNISLSLLPDTKEEATKLFDALSKGGKVEVPLAVAPWGALFGMVDDQFGIKWMVNVDYKK